MVRPQIIYTCTGLEAPGMYPLYRCADRKTDGFRTNITEYRRGGLYEQVFRRNKIYGYPQASQANAARNDFHGVVDDQLGDIFVLHFISEPPNRLCNGFDDAY